MAGSSVHRHSLNKCYLLQLNPLQTRPTNTKSSTRRPPSPCPQSPPNENKTRKTGCNNGCLGSVLENDVDTYYEKLLARESGIILIDRFDASKFRTRFGGQIRGFKSDGYIDGKNDRRLDDCLRYCIVAGKKALEDAHLGGDKLYKF